MNPPADFPLEEYDVLRNGCGMVTLDGWTSVVLTGKDRQSFLNSFCTNDVKKMTKGDTCEAFITNVKGKVLGHVLVICRDEELELITVPDQAERLMSHLDRYIIREDVQLRDTTDQRGFLLLTGKNAFSPRRGENVLFWSPLSTDVRVLITTASAEFSEVRDERIRLGTRLGGKIAFEALRIEAGMPLFGLDFDEENLPQEIGRDELAISFIKGCYLGQETVARIDALGHVNQQIVGVRFAGTVLPAKGTELTSGGAPAGRVTSATYSPLMDAPLALAMVRRNWTAPGSKLDSAAGTCEVIDLPVHE